jgi:ubiquinone/menaquinone biosynthesis C-methylase UbiE
LENPKRIVAHGYDIINQDYLKMIDYTGPVVREKYLNIIEGQLPKGARILELGCGAGIPMTRRLAVNYGVTGLDISKEQLKLAVLNVSEASFVLADMTRLPFAENKFDAVAAFYCINHVRREDHRDLLGNIHRILKPGGLFIATMGSGNLPDSIEPDWLGAPMFFSHYDGETNVRMAKEAGFTIINAEDESETELGKKVVFRWIVARK